MPLRVGQNAIHLLELLEKGKICGNFEVLGILGKPSEGGGYYIEDQGPKRASGFGSAHPTGGTFGPHIGRGCQNIGEFQLSFLTESEVESDSMIVILSQFSNNMYTYFGKKERRKALCRAK